VSPFTNLTTSCHDESHCSQGKFGDSVDDMTEISSAATIIGGGGGGGRHGGGGGR
jgi:hypothetical protein